MLKICKFTVIDGVQRFEICSRCTFPLPENVLKLSWYFFHTHVECGRRHFSIKFQANCSHYCCPISFKQTDEPTHMHVGAWNRFYFVAFAQEIVISVGGKKPVSVLLDQFPSPPAAPAATGAIPPRGNTVSQLSFRCWRVGGAILHALFDRGNRPRPRIRTKNPVCLCCWILLCHATMNRWVTASCQKQSPSPFQTHTHSGEDTIPKTFLGKRLGRCRAHVSEHVLHSRRRRIPAITFEFRHGSVVRGNNIDLQLSGTVVGRATWDPNWG